MAQDRPRSTTSLDATISAWQGNENRDALQDDLNPTKHSFRKAKHDKVTPTWGGFRERNY